MFYKVIFIMKKIVCSFLIIIFLIIPNIAVLANEDDDEDFDINQIQEEILQVQAEPTKEPSINSRAAVVLDRESKRVLYAKNADDKRAMASTTKIMTCIIALENMKLDEVITVSKKATGVGGSRLGLSAGDKITANDLLYGLMLRSRQ